MRHSKHMSLLYAAVAMAAIPLCARQATPCQQQQAGPQDTIDALSQNLDDMSGLADQYIAFVVASDGIQADLRAQIATLLAGDAALAAKADAAFAKSEAAENKMRAGLPGVPPVGGTPLNTSYADGASFDAAVAAYTGPEAVNKDGIEVKAGTAPALEYFSHSADGTVSTSGPTD